MKNYSYQRCQFYSSSSQTDEDGQTHNEVFESGYAREDKDGEVKYFEVSPRDNELRLLPIDENRYNDVRNELRERMRPQTELELLREENSHLRSLLEGRRRGSRRVRLGGEPIGDVIEQAYESGLIHRNFARMLGNRESNERILCGTEQ